MQTPTRYDHPEHPVAQTLDALAEAATRAHRERKDAILDAVAARLGLDAETYVRVFGREDYYTVVRADRSGRTASRGRAATETPEALVARVLG